MTRHGHPDSKVVVAPPDSLRRRRLLAVLVVVAFMVGAGGFGYAIIANSNRTDRAQRTADQASAAQLYGLQLFCTQIRATEAVRELHTSKQGRDDLARLAHYYAELKCDDALRKPLVPLGKTGTKLGGDKAKPSPSPSSRAGPSTAPGASGPTATPAPGSSPPRTPRPSPTPTRQTPTPSPSRTPVVCVTVGPLHQCAGGTLTGFGRVAAHHPQGAGRHFDA